VSVGTRAWRRFPIRLFLDRQRFAGERGFLDMQIVALDQAGVGGDQVAGRQADDVARDQRAAGEFAPCAVA
jgi:hypothetical protein